MVSAAAFTYKTKGEAEDELRAVRKLEAQIRFEEETIDLLKADWSLLTQPSRLQTLAAIYHEELNLAPVEAQQIADPRDIPMRPPEPVAEAGETTADIAPQGADQTTTGSTGQ